ncbi:MAG: hypothetical protein V4532_01135, partial [Pseudomonadota bacterium]
NWTITPVPEPGGLALALEAPCHIGNASDQKNMSRSKSSSSAEESGYHLVVLQPSLQPFRVSKH